MRTSFLRTSTVVTVVVLAGAAGGAADARTPATSPRAPSRALARSAYSDFNGDGYNDVVIAAPFDDVGDVPGAGVVHVIYGGPNGPSTSRGPGGQLWHQNIAGIADHAEANDHFGWAVAAGNFDGDAYGDLAIGVPSEDIEDPQDVDPPIMDVGLAHVLYGSAAGLRATDSKVAGFQLTQLPGSQIGYALAVPDALKDHGAIGTDGHTELAIGAPGYGGRGGVLILQGSYVDRSFPSSQQGTSLAFASSERGARFGSSVAAGFFDHEVGDAVAIGVPRADVNVGTTTAVDAGKVVLLDYAESGATTFGQAGTTGDGRPETDDRFGSALAAGDINEDGYDDLAVGAPFEDFGAKADAGLVQLFFSKAAGSGIDPTVAVGLGLFRPGVPGDPAAGDHLGAAIVIADFGDPPTTSAAAAKALDLDHLDVAIGVPGRAVNGRPSAGAVAVLYRRAGGWNDVHNDLWTQDSAGVAEIAEGGDAFGSTLSTGHLRNDKRSALVVGVPREDLGSIADAGVVQILFGTAAGLRPMGQQFWSQDVPGVSEAAQPGDRFGAALQ